MQIPYPLSPTAGTIAPDKIVGRMEEIAQLKKMLVSQSVMLDEIRRMGKTLFLQKFAYLSVQNNEPNKAIYFIFQGTQDINSLTDVLSNELRSKEKHGWLKVQMNRCHCLYHTLLSGAKAGLKYNDIEFSFALPEFKTEWNRAFRACIEDLADRQTDKHETITLIFDELPMMLWQWISNGKAQDAMALLDLLRAIHYDLKDSSRIRFVFCGSIGMAVVLAKLRRDCQYTGEAFNFTQNFPLPPMTDSDAQFLCECLYLSGFQCDNETNKLACFRKITETCNRLPYFINGVFGIIQIQHNGLVSGETIENAIYALLTDTGSASDVFNQLNERLTIYYPADHAETMHNCLNVLANTQLLLSETELAQKLTADDDQIKAALETLWRDELLTRTFDKNENRLYAFKYSLIKRWWKLNKA